MAQTITILDGYSDREKGAYLGAIASIATADREAGEEEMAYIDALIESANISDEQAGIIRNAASSNVSDSDLKHFLDELKGSELRFSLVSDVIAFSQSDSNYSEEEKRNVESIANYLGVNQEQFSVLDQFTRKAVNEAPQQAAALESEQQSPQGFLENLGFGDKLKNAGINTSSLMKGALGILGPILLAKMFSGRRGASGGGGGALGGLLGGGLGGLLAGGGLGSLLGGSRGSGGLLGGLLGGGRGFGAAGGLLGRILGGGR